jgi:hypothetical protein
MSESRVRVFWLPWFEEGKANYHADGTPAELVRIGVCRPSNTKVGTKPSGPIRADGTMHVCANAARAIAHDARFRAAIDRVLAGAPCPDFSLPARRKRHLRDGDDAAAA